MIVRRRVLVSGKVQGVGFRQSTFQEIRSQKTVSGFVRNLPDGQVEAVFHGEEHEVLHLVRWCAHGPRSAVVERLEVREEDCESGERFEGFVIR